MHRIPLNFVHDVPLFGHCETLLRMSLKLHGHFERNIAHHKWSYVFLLQREID